MGILVESYLGIYIRGRIGKERESEELIMYSEAIGVFKIPQI